MTTSNRDDVPASPVPRPVGNADDPTVPPRRPSPDESTYVGPPPFEPHAAPATGRQCGEYELIEEIARGGMGVVYKARHVTLNRIVALKMILSGQLASDEDVRRFYAEAEAAAKLEHAGIVPIYEIGQHEERHYFSMPFVDGESLAVMVERGPLPHEQAARYVLRVAEAVHEAHRQGIVHRDLKPANILVDADGAPRVTDFGLAKHFERGNQVTATGQVLGTPSYMSPEQAGGDSDRVGPLADVYALGAILYCLLTGRPPFGASNPTETLLQVLHDDPVRPRSRRPGTPRELEAICLKCLAKDPGRRYPTAAALAADLLRFLNGEPTGARPPNVVRRLAYAARGKPALAATIFGACLFYANHLFNLLVLQVPETGGAFHWEMTGLLVSWVAVAALCQRGVVSPKYEEAAKYTWAIMEVCLLTGLLLLADGPTSPVLGGYVLLVGVSLLRQRVLLVWLVTGLGLCGYTIVVVDAFLRRPELVPSSKAVLPFVLTMLIMGTIQHLGLRRIRRAAAVPFESTERIGSTSVARDD